MYTINREITDTFREKGSKFIGLLFPAADMETFEKRLDAIKSKHPGATHHCFAWRMNPADPREYAQDDGEPSGTAGRPILNQLRSFEVINAGLVVVRYFGGTKLGKPGLIEAYGRSAANCLEQADRHPIIRTRNFRIKYPYNQQNAIDQLRNTFHPIELEATYLEDVTLKLACPLDQAGRFADELDKLEPFGIESERLDDDFLAKT